MRLPTVDQLQPWPDPPPAPSWLHCPDCAGTVAAEGTADRRVMAWTVTHDPTCPAWDRPEREVVFALGSTTDNEGEKA